jgi:hypothetical protein
MHLESWRKSHKGKKIKPGEILTLPPSKHCDAQTFTVKDVIPRYLKGKTICRAHVVWTSTCCICQAPFQFYKILTSRSLVRTCPLHRGLKPKHTLPKPPTAPYKPETPLRDTLVACLADCACTSPTIDLTAFVEYCMSMMEPPETGRDTRRQCVVACLRRMDRRGAWPHGVTLRGNLLNFAS